MKSVRVPSIVRVDEAAIGKAAIGKVSRLQSARSLVATPATAADCR